MRAVFALLLAAPAAAAAPGFDATTGTVSTAGAAFAISFDDAGALQGHGLYGYDVFTQQTSDEVAVAGRINRDDGAALEGAGALALGGDLNYVSLDTTSLTDLVGKRVEFHLWQQPHGTRMIPTIAWYAGDVANPDFIGSINFQPTGLATDDGWEEWSSGPVDFAWAGQVPATAISLLDENVSGAYAGLAENKDARALIDALYAVDLGPAAIAPNACTLVDEHDTCGDGGLCHMGRCVDAAIRAGQPFLEDGLRNDYIDRRVFEVRSFEGGRAPEGRVGLVADALNALKTSPKASSFWPSFSTAYTLLIDGHASAPLLGYPAYQNGGVCVHQGIADLLPGSPTLPLVFQPGANALFADLQPGDALVQIDGMPVEDWAAQAGRLITHPGDPLSRAVVTAPAIFVAAMDTGASVRFARCPTATPCAAEDVVNIDLDLGVLVGDALLAGQSPVSYNDVAACDYRFVRPVPSGTVANTDYTFAGSADEGDVRFLVINGVPPQYESQPWFDAVDAALSSDPSQLVLDERTGDGGGIDAVDWIGGELSAPGDLFAMDFLPAMESDDLSTDRNAIVTCSDNGGPNAAYGCGNGLRWPFGFTAGDKLGEAKDAKLAILIGLDVSGNDYLTKILRGRTGETRVFGSGSTWGAFGVIWSMAAHMGEVSGGSLQVQDTIFMKTADDANVDFPTSTGERPDEEVLQKQSDAVQGKDTAIEAAKLWLGSST